jgi:hypothetical protein
MHSMLGDKTIKVVTAAECPPVVATGVKEFPKSHAPGTVMDRVMSRREEVQRFQVDAEADRKQDRPLVTVPAFLISNELRKAG